MRTLQMRMSGGRSKRVYGHRFFGLAGIGLVLFAAILMSTAAAQASDEAATSYRLVRTVEGVFDEEEVRDKIVFIDFARAHAQGGQVQLRVRHSASCEETYYFDWSFDQDITQLRPGDRFVITVSNSLVGDLCTTDHDAFIRACGSRAAGSGVMSDMRIKNSQFTSGTTHYVYAKEWPGLVVGSDAAEIYVDEFAKDDPMWFHIVIFAGSHGGSIKYEAAYLYKAEPPAPGPIKLSEVLKKASKIGLAPVLWSAGGLALGGRIIAILPCPWCKVAGGLVTITGGGVALVGLQLKEWEEEPPDPNYRVIAEPEVPPLPPLPAGVPRELADAANALNINLLQTSALSAVLLKTLERAQGALDAGDDFWQTKQMEVSTQYASQWATLVNAQPALLANLGSALQTAGVSDITITVDDVRNFQADVAANGLPSSFIDVLNQLGADSATIDWITELFITQDPNAVAGSFLAKLTDPAFNFALQEAAQVLDEYAKSIVQPSEPPPPLLVTPAPSITFVGIPDALVIDSPTGWELGFLDPDGDINLIRFEKLIDGSWQPDGEWNPEVQGQIQGTISIESTCRQLGIVQARVTLFDAAGNSSGPTEYSFECVSSEAGRQGNNPPWAPTLLYPPNSWCPALDPNSITFQWQDNGDPDGDPLSFQIEIYEYNSYSEQWQEIYASEVAGTSITLEGFNYDGYFSWCVYAIDPAGRSDPAYAVSDWSYFSTAFDYCSR